VVFLFWIALKSFIIVVFHCGFNYLLLRFDL